MSKYVRKYRFLNRTHKDNSESDSITFDTNTSDHIKLDDDEDTNHSSLQLVSDNSSLSDCASSSTAHHYSSSSNDINVSFPITTYGTSTSFDPSVATTLSISSIRNNCNSEDSLRNFLLNWAVNNSITAVQCTSLLKGLKKNLTNDTKSLPSDYRTLLNTMKVTSLKEAKKLCNRPLYSYSCEESATDQAEKIMSTNEVKQYIDPVVELRSAGAQFDAIPGSSKSQIYKTNTTAPIESSNQVLIEGIISKLENIDKKFTRKLDSIKYDIRKMEDTLSNLKDLLQNKFSLKDEVADTNNQIKIYEMLPIRTIEDVEIFEEKLEDENFVLQFVQYLYLLGGATAHKAVYLQMKKLFDYNLTQKYSGLGRKGKRSFNILKLYSAIQDATRKRFPDTIESDIKKSVGLFLAGAKGRSRSSSI